jgi:hypothetical protein
MLRLLLLVVLLSFPSLSQATPIAPFSMLLPNFGLSSSQPLVTRVIWWVI